MAKIVTITFFSDSLEGSHLVQLGNHVCRLYDLIREDDASFKSLAEVLDTPALYILLNRKDHQAYIGQTDCFIKRISQHMAKKGFWDEVLVFTASDGSINATEVQFLEAAAYSAAKEAGSYDLSENSQEPRPHKINPLAKYNALDFFKVVRDLSKIVGCNIFVQADKERPPQKVSLTKTDTTAQNSDSLKGTRVKIYLNGKGPFNKRKFVLEVVREFLRKNPQVTIPQLKELFPRTLLGSWGNWNLIETDIDAARNLVSSGSSPVSRHFVKDDCILVSPGDGVPFVVASQWDYNNLQNILSLVKHWGWDYQIIKK